MFEANRNRRRLTTAALIALAAASLGVLADWRAPGMSRYTKDWLMRERGPLPVPAEIAIVAIDEKSIAAFGRFPWSRQILAKTIDVLSGYEPKVIAVDVLFPDSTSPEEDEMLARSIGRAGNVVLAAQLIDSPERGRPTAWLMPLPELASATAGVGHVNVQMEMEGVARQIAVQAADDAGHTVRSISVEAVRVADQTPDRSVSFTAGSLVLGARAIPVDLSRAPVLIAQTGPQTTKRVQTGRMTIDYIGPAGSFDPVTYSVADVLWGIIPASRFRGKYVLIGATAASESDRVATPFVHQTDTHADEHGALMPGVEVMANAVNTILRSRFYSETGDASGFFWATLVAALTLLLLELSQGRMEVARQAGALVILAGSVVLASYLVFAHLLVFPPLVPALSALTSAAMMGLLWRSLVASSQLDTSIAHLSHSSDILAAPSHNEPSQTAFFPHGLEWKAQKIRELNARLTERARLVDLALRSIDDGLIIATPEGAITFANRSAGTILQTPARILIGRNLFERLGLSDGGLLRRLVADRAHLEREIEIGGKKPHRFVLRMASVAASEDPGEPVYGIVASLSDVTRQHQLQRTKNDVIALVSHEMRTPLTAIQGMTELLAKYDIDSARRKEISAAINAEVKRLTNMITEYLDITRLVSGATPVRKAPLKVENLLRRVLLMLEPIAAQRSMKLVLKADASLPALVADVELLGRAMENLVSNAIKYSPDGTEVLISAAVHGDTIAISVADQGYGIPEADLSRVFEKFYRVPRLEDADVPGTGLGLALVREIADLHGGTVTVTSKVNAGSTFVLRIPLVAEAGADSTLEE